MKRVHHSLSLEVRLEPGEPVVRQRCELVLKFLANATSFAGALQYPDVDIPGALVVKPQSGLSTSERRHGETWVGVETSYAVYPHRSGRLEIPSITVSALARYGVDRVQVQASSKPFEVAVNVPRDIADVADVVVTPRLSIEHSLQNLADTLMVGNAFRRIAYAPKTRGMQRTHIL